MINMNSLQPTHSINSLNQLGSSDLLGNIGNNDPFADQIDPISGSIVSWNGKLKGSVDGLGNLLGICGEKTGHSIDSYELQHLKSLEEAKLKSADEATDTASTSFLKSFKFSLNDETCSGCQNTSISLALDMVCPVCGRESPTKKTYDTNVSLLGYVESLFPEK